MSKLKKCFNGKKVLLTGHTGFKGSWLTIWLKALGADVIGLSVDVPSKPSNYEASELQSLITDYTVDIRDADKVKDIVQKHSPDFVFHLAAQALVRPSYESPLETIETNALGSANILDALRSVSHPVVAVMITSDKAYDNVEWVWGYRETDRLGGKDPYSASKGMAELAIRTYVESFFNQPDSNVRVGITRAGNVIGGGDWAKDRIVPDCIRAWSAADEVEIRSPHATRPWQHVLEPLSGYLVLAMELSKSQVKNGEAYNFGPQATQNYSVGELIHEMCKHWDSVSWKDVSTNQENVHEAGLLKLNCDKALFDLQWLPTLNYSEMVQMTIEWYKEYYDSKPQSMIEYSMSQIENYMMLANERGLAWAME